MTSGESLAQASLKKRRGLVIVKKKKPEPVSKPEVTKPTESLKNTIPTTLESMFGSAAETTESKKKSLPKK